MSGADDQRAADIAVLTTATAHEPLAGPALARLRAELAAEREHSRRALLEVDDLRLALAETHARRDYLQGQLDIIYDAEYSRNDTLQRRIEKLVTAGDALADQAVDAAGRLSACGEDDMSDATLTQVHAWRSVRGDAPTQPPADGMTDAERAMAPFLAWVQNYRENVAPEIGRAFQAWLAGFRPDAAAVPPKSTESPAGELTALAVQVWQSDDGDWGWACARCDYRSVAWWSDRAVAERAAVEHGRDRCRAGGSAPASTDGDQP